MPYFLAIDAGGTKTNCVLASSDRILARASTGSVKLMRVSVADATTRLHTMLAEASASAGIPLTEITRTCFGLAGLTIPAVRAWATATIAAHVSGSLILCGDEEIALDAAFSGGPGVLVIAGTGSNIIGRAADGTLHSAGGWGPVLGDEGAGYWIGLEAIRAALRARDRGKTETSPQRSGAPSMTASLSWVESANPGVTPSAALLLEIQHHWNLNSLSELIELGNHRGDANRPAPDFASLTPIVARCAQQGNPLAAAILHRAGTDLADLVTLVTQKIQVPHVRPEFHRVEHGVTSEPVVDSPPAKPDLVASTFEVAFTGSIITHIAPVREAMIARLAVTAPTAQVQPTAIDPLDGALWRARRS